MALQSYRLTIGALIDENNSGKNYVSDQPVYIKTKAGVLAPIFRDINGASEIFQDGLSNKTDSRGQFVFFVEQGDYIAEYQSQQTPISVFGADYFNSRIEESVTQITADTALSRGYNRKGTFASGFTYELANDVGIDANGDAWVYTNIDALPVIVSAGTVPSEIEYTLVVIGNFEYQLSEHNSDPNAHPELSAFITSEANRAELAADTALVNSTVYPDEATGRAAVADGDYFKVIGSGDIAAHEYQRINGSTSTFITSYPSAKAVEDLGSQFEVFETMDNDVVDSLMVLDIDGRVMLELKESEAVDNIEHEVFEYIGDSPYILLDSDNRVLISDSLAQSGVDIEALSQMVETNSDNITSVSERINKSLNDYGLNRTHVFGEWYLREFRQRSRKLKLGEDEQLTVACIGDSWTHRGERYVTPLGLTLQSDLGGTSAGFTGFSWGFGDLPEPSGLNGNYDPSSTSVSIVGDWVKKYSNQESPDICSAETSTVGDTITVITSKIATNVALYAEQTGGVISYRFDSGAWESVTLNGSNDLTSLSNVPVSGFTLEIRVDSGVVNLYGVNMTNDDSGVIIHKLGATGTQLAQWGSRSSSEKWKENMASLSPNLITILHGTNDQTADFTKGYFKSKGQDLINNIKSVLPLTDIMLIAPCENGRNNAIPMSAYQDAFQELAYENGCAFINLQHVFGDEFSEYASTSPRNWFNADLIHPEPLTGGRAIVDVIERTLLNR